MRNLSFLAAITLLPSCAVFPFPHTVVESPSIEGAVTRNGEPVEGLRIYHHVALPLNARACAPSETHVVTDRRGIFSFQKVTDFEFFVVVAGDEFPTWACALRTRANWCKGGLPPKSEEHILQLSSTANLTMKRLVELAGLASAASRMYKMHNIALAIDRQTATRFGSLCAPGGD